jgi:hypothetical protein
MAIFPKEKKKAPKMAHHDLSHYLRTSMAPGLGYPILCVPCNAGDQHQLEFKHLMNTQAILNPLYGSYRLQICVFFAGISLYIPRLWRNGFMNPDQTGVMDVNFPFLHPDSHKPMYQVSESSLPAFLGMGYHAGRFSSSPNTFPVNLIPYLMYYDIFRHYYANRQEIQYPVMMGMWDQSTRVSRYKLSDLDDLYMELPYSGGDMSGYTNLQQTPIFAIFKKQEPTSSALPSMSVPLGGLWQACYMPDRMNVILSDAFFKKNVSTVVVSTAGDSFQVDQLVTAKKLWNSRNNDVITNGTFKDYFQ